MPVKYHEKCLVNSRPYTFACRLVVLLFACINNLFPVVEYIPFPAEVSQYVTVSFFSRRMFVFFINVRICRLASLLSIWLFNRLIRRIGSVLRPSRSLNGVSIRPVGGGLISSCQTKTWDDGRDRERNRDTERAREREKWRERDDLFWSSASKPVSRSIVAVNYMLQMFYSLAISVSNLHAMYQPISSIPTNGTVPTKPAGKKKNIKIYTATILTHQNTSRHIILP